MHDILIALACFGILFLPVLVSARMAEPLDKDQPKTESDDHRDLKL